MEQDTVAHREGLADSLEAPADESLPAQPPAKTAFEVQEREGARRAIIEGAQQKKGKKKLLLLLGKLNSEPTQLIISILASLYQAFAVAALVREWPFGCGAWWPSNSRQMSFMTASILGTLLCVLWGASGRSALDIYLLSLYFVWVSIWFFSVATDVSGFQQYFCVCGALVIMFFYSIFALRLIRHVLQLRQLPRLLMSKQKRRLVDEQFGFDLDLTYIAAKVIAMGWPSNDLLESGIRNQMSEVQRYLQTWHPGHHRVYNLCSERKFPDGSFEDECQLYRFPDHNPGRMEDLINLCEDIQRYLDRSWSNVVAIHCKAGKGRTGLVICAYLLHSRKARTAEAALNLFGTKRTYNGKGVTIPSQIRYIYNYEIVRKENCILRDPKWFSLHSLDISGVAETGNWEFSISTHEEGKVFSSGSSDQTPPEIEGDIKILVSLDGQKVFQFWFHTAYNLQRLRDDIPASTPIWTSHSQKLKQDASNGWCIHLDSTQLDFQNKKAGKEENNHLEVTVTFCEADRASIELQQAERDRSRSSQKNAGSLQDKMLKKKKKQEERLSPEAHSFTDFVKHVKSKSSTRSSTRSSSAHDKSDGSDLDDDVEEEEDLLSNLTDLEMMLSSLYTGYLNHTKNRCIGEQRRWCALHINGYLNITDDNAVKTVDLTEKNVRSVFKKVKGEPRWWIKPLHSRFWESIQALPGEEEWWTKAFSDAIRLGEARRDPDIAFCGFFWKLVQAATAPRAKDSLQSDLSLTDWRIRLFILRKDGTLWYHSWKEGASDIKFCDVTQDTVTRLEISKWACWDYVVPFMVRSGEGKNMLLAGAPQDLDVFTMHVQGVMKAHLKPEELNYKAQADNTGPALV